jgi:ankyrin repeat protein
MRERERRNFLKGSALAAGWAAIATGLSGSAGKLLAGAGDAERPPTRRFIEAVVQGDTTAVSEWLTRDPGLLHARDGSGRTAFALALLNRHVSIAELLRERGYQPDLHESALALDWERFEELAAATPGMVNQDHPIGGTAMYAAAIGGAGNQIWRVYRYGGNPDRNPRGAAGSSALRVALDHPDLALAELTCSTLLGNGASPNAPQIGGSSVLHAAARRGSTAIVEVLIRKGADLDATDDDGRTPLELARDHGRRDVITLIENHDQIPRDHSSSRSVYDLDGEPYRSPDLSAFSIIERTRVVGVSHGGLDALRVAVGRNPSLAHSVAMTTESAVEAGAHMGRPDIVDFLLDRGAAYSLPTAVMRNDLARARVLLDEDPLRIHERGPHDFALLWYPVIGKGLSQMAELLLDHGASVERQHVLGTTALHYASLGGQIEMVQLLIERGADVNRAGRKFAGTRETPLQLAEARGHDKVVRLLRERGARA